MKLDLGAFIHERAERLATVYLSRNDNLAIAPMDADHGLDMLVTVLQDQLATGRMFGVLVKGQDGTLRNSRKEVVALSAQDMQPYRDLPFPVCVFLFTMDDDKGYYTWLDLQGMLNDASSGVAVRSRPRASSFDWKLLGDYPVKQMVDDVNAWYDAKQQRAA